MPGRRKSSRQRGSSIVFRDDYEIESGQGNDTASGRQTERRAVESPHDREARLFQGLLRDRERARQRYCFCSKKQTGTTPGRRKSSRQRGLVFFRDYYEIESGQGNDTASVPRSRQAQRQAVESPHDREASSFSGTITRSRAGKATILLLFQEADRQNARPSKVLTTARLVDRFQGRLRDRERARQRYCFLVDRQNARPSKVLTTERLVFFRDH